MSETGLNEQIAARVRQLRAARGLSLEGLAERSGVSRSMISLIERGETSPTAVVLERLAVGLDITLAGLFDPPQGLADPRPAEALIKSLGIASGDGVEDEDRAASRDRRLLGGLHQPRPDAVPTSAPMHEHLGNIRAMRLVLRRRKDELHRADDAVLILGDQQHATTLRDIVGKPAPEACGPLSRERQHEAHRGPAFDTVDEDIGQLRDLLLVEARQAANGDPGISHRCFCLCVFDDHGLGAGPETRITA